VYDISCEDQTIRETVTAPDAFLVAVMLSLRSDWLGSWLLSRQSDAVKQDRLREDKLAIAALNLVGPNAVYCSGGAFYNKRSMSRAVACAVALRKSKAIPFTLHYGA
jgi:hypothetical protein